MLPSCQRQLFQHTLRTPYISNVWNISHLQVPLVLLPSEYGWKENEGTLECKWFTDEQLSKTDKKHCS